MKIVYEDEYGEVLFKGTSTVLPNSNDPVVLDEVEWFVKSRIFHPEDDTVVIVVAENAESENFTEAKDSRLNEMKSAILDLRRRQDKNESKGRLLREQLVSIRSFLRTQQKPTK